MSDKVKIEQVQEVISKLDNKEFGMYFFTLDTKGNATAGIANIYEHVKMLRELGYDAQILTEKNDYKLRADAEGPGIAEWLGEEYANIPHISTQSQTLNIGPQDFIIIPEIFANVMDQVKKFPCKKIVLSQSYDYAMELLPIGRKWTDYGFNDVITTSKKQAAYLKKLFPSINCHIVPVGIPEFFKDSDKPKIPVVSVVTRNQADAAKIAKLFYLQHPMFKWVTFKQLTGLSRQKFAEELSKSCLSVWVDEPSGFGTFPLESIQCNTPVVGVMPNMIPEWMEEVGEDGKSTIKNNGIWTNTLIGVPELISTYLGLWLESNVPQELLDNMETTKNIYTMDKQRESVEAIYANIVEQRKGEFKQIMETVSQDEATKE